MLKTVLRSNQIVTYFEDNRKQNKVTKTEVIENQLLTNLTLGSGNMLFLSDFGEKVDSEFVGDLSEISEKFKIERTGFLSYKAQRDIKRRVDTWTESFSYHKGKCQISKKKNNHLFTFVTLTYPSEQMHDDNFLKREHLNHFIITSKRKWNIENYLWRAEVQANGNLHFHLLYDRFINHVEIKNTWNEIIEGQGYVTRYQKKNGNKIPNSTDIHGLKNIENISSYIAKYMSKNEDKEQKRRGVDGNLHGCSDKIRDIKQPVICTLLDSVDYSNDRVKEVDSLIDFVRYNDLVKWEAEAENYSTTIVTKISMLKILQAFGGSINTAYQEHYKNISKQLFT
jgi:hypothetical protein